MTLLYQKLFQFFQGRFLEFQITQLAHDVINVRLMFYGRYGCYMDVPLTFYASWVANVLRILEIEL